MSQAIVINGESGSGKTVSTSHIIDYLCNDASWPSTCAKSALLSPRLRHSGALFESLGNACTVRNNNSRSQHSALACRIHVSHTLRLTLRSRYAKFIRMRFDRTASIQGAVLNTCVAPI
jgi:myosin heavy subunit